MEFTRNDIRNIAFEAINDRFSKGVYLGVEVTIDMTNGYINGPHLVGQVKTKGGEPKKFNEWKRSKESKILLEFLTAEISSFEPIVDVTDSPNGLRGAYIHPHLVSHVAQWASPIFAHKVSVILNNYAITEAIRKKDIVISSLETKIDEQNAKIDEQNKKIDELLDYAREAKEETAQVLVELDNVSVEAKETNERLETVQTKLGIAVERRVPLDPVSLRNETFTIYGKPGQNDYKVIRCQHKNKPQSVTRCKSQGYTQLIYSKDDPNAVNIWNRVRESIKGVGRVTGGYFIKIAPGKTIDDLLRLIATVEEEKREVD